MLAVFTVPTTLLAQDEMDMIFLDFGTGVPSPAPYNDITDTEEFAIDGLRNARNLNSGYGLEITDAFGGANGNGTTEPDASLGLRASATADSFFGSAIEFNERTEPTGAVTISGLATDVEYTFTIFASRVTTTDEFNRESTYTLTGTTTETGSLDATNNTSETVTLTTTPDSEGNIVLSATTGEANTTAQGFYYLGAVTISYPQQEATDDNPTECVFVVLGSSTAVGTGATDGNGWAQQYAEYLAEEDKFSLVNLAEGGFTTYHILPNGAQRPSDVNIPVRTDKNITAALAFSPAAIIVNMPSNDANQNISVEEQMANFATIVAEAEGAGVPIYITTTQPRNFNNDDNAETKQANLIATKDAILEEYGDNAIDFWTGVANEDGSIMENLDSGDGIHLNDDGHAILYGRVTAKNIDDLPCGTGIFAPAIQELAGVSVFPNPANNGVVYVELAAELRGEVIVRVSDLLGRERLRKSVDLAGASRRIEVPTAGLVRGSGEYLLITVINQDGDGLRQKTLPVMVR